MRTTIDMPDAILTEAKARALAHGKTLSVWISEVVAQAVRERATAGAQRPRIKLPTAGRKGDPMPSWDQLVSWGEHEEFARLYPSPTAHPRAAEPTPPYAP
jgi:hypothetical protein